MTNQSVGRTIVALAVIASACVKQPARSADSANGAAETPSPPMGAPPATRSDSTRPIELRTDRTTYRAGDQVTMTIVNHTSQGWAFNPCTRIIERNNGGRWEATPDARRCTMIAWILKGGETRTATTNFDSSLNAGSYRLVIGFSPDGPSQAQQTTAASAPVTITK